MIRLKTIKESPATLNIEAVQVGDEVHLRREGEQHAFVVVKRDKGGRATVGIVDTDTGCRDWRDIASLCWQR